ncbi:MAG: HD-GYP domain-containing protein [Dehalobacterium sp.]
MRRVNILRLKPGMRVGRPIYNNSLGELLVKGSELTDSYIKRLQRLGIEFVWIDDGQDWGIEEKEVIDLKTRIETIRQIRDIALKTKAIGKLSVEPEELYSTVKEFNKQLFKNSDALYNLSSIQCYDDYTFCHSVNVCILSLMTGISLGYSNDQLNELGVGALLHDLGKIKVPEEILNKKGKLTDEEYGVVKMHVTYGYELIRDAKNLGEVPALIALEHHENYDGTGYPNGFSKDKLPEYAQVVAIADRFDAIASDRVYRKAFSPQEAYEMCAASGNLLFKDNIVKAFLYNIAIYPQGSLVELNNGYVAVVLDTPRGYPIFPRVKVLHDGSERLDKQNIEISLLDRGDIYIVRTLNGEEDELAGII